MMLTEATAPTGFSQSTYLKSRYLEPKDNGKFKIVTNLRSLMTGALGLAKPYPATTSNHDH